MATLGFIGRLFGRQELPAAMATAPEPAAEAPRQQYEIVQGKPMATADWGSIGAPQGSAVIIRSLFSGEKTEFEMGPIKRYEMDTYALGNRAWQMDVESESCHTVVEQKGRWVLGTGLTLEAAPAVDVLEMLGIKLDGKWSETWTKQVENLWNIAANKSTMMDHKHMDTFQKLTKRIYKNAQLWGHVLIVHRVNKDTSIVTTQIIDGEFLMTPYGRITLGGETILCDNKVGYDWIYPKTGNRVRRGVEIEDSGEHVAYWVKNGLGLDYKRIPARNSKGMLMAYLVYGKEHRLENTTGIPETTVIMENASLLDEYTSATVSTVKERAKVVYTIEHEKGTEEKDPRTGALAQLTNRFPNQAPVGEPTDVEGRQLAKTVAATTKNTTFNMPAGASLETPDFKQETHYKEFRDTRFNADSAAVGMPPEVASQLYGGSYSASRAATNGFQFSLYIDRDDIGSQLHQRTYNLQMLVWILKGTIQAPGFLEAWYAGNEMVTAAYLVADWSGAPVPQVDGLKQVMEERLKLGLGSPHMPLSNFEKVCRTLGTGKYAEIAKQYAREMEEADALGIEKVETRGTVIEDFDDPKEDKKGKPGTKGNDQKGGAKPSTQNTAYWEGVKLMIDAIIATERMG